MVTIFSGVVNSGKTTALLEHYQTHLKGEGFISLKTMEAGGVKCYDALQLSTGSRFKLAYHEKFRPTDWNSDLNLGPYSFDEKLFLMVENRVRQCVPEGIGLFYLDEIGVLEIRGDGFAKGIECLLENQIHLFMAVRSDLIEKVVQTFKISEYQIVPVQRKEG